LSYVNQNNAIKQSTSGNAMDVSKGVAYNNVQNTNSISQSQSQNSNSGQGANNNWNNNNNNQFNQYQAQYGY
jgi:hypothetical protein